MIKKLILLFGIFFAICSAPLNLHAGTSLPDASDIADWGMWTTENNQEKLINNATSDLERFQGNFQNEAAKVLKDDYVPIEAKVGLAFINAMSNVGEALSRSLFDFIRILMLVLFAFWIMFESYNTMQGDSDIKKLVMAIAKKALMITVWFFVLSNNPAEIFMTIFGPVISAGAYMSDLILDAVAGSANVKLPDTCAAIGKFVGDNGTVISSSQTAALLCMPTRLSGFFYTCVAAGFKWMWYGIGHSALTFFAGAVFVVMFVINIWKFALLAFGVIADLFLAIMLLPFTAVVECFGGKKGTNLGGPAGDIFNAFAKMFEASSLPDQIQRFIGAVIYFIMLSIVAAIGVALLGGVVGTDLAASVPTVESESFMSVLIVGCLVGYLVTKAGDFAEAFSGKVDKEYSKQIGDDIKKAWENTTGKIKEWREILKDKKS